MYACARPALEKHSAWARELSNFKLNHISSSEFWRPFPCFPWLWDLVVSKTFWWCSFIWRAEAWFWFYCASSGCCAVISSSWRGQWHLRCFYGEVGYCLVSCPFDLPHYLSHSSWSYQEEWDFASWLSWSWSVFSKPFWECLHCSPDLPCFSRYSARWRHPTCTSFPCQVHFRSLYSKTGSKCHWRLSYRPEPHLDPGLNRLSWCLEISCCTVGGSGQIFAAWHSGSPCSRKIIWFSK